MSGLCGWAGHTADEESRRRLLARMAEALSRRDRSEVETRCSVGCAVAVASLRGNASVVEERTLLAAIAGRPVWHDQGLADLAAAKGHAHALAEAYAARGPRLLDILGGTFALAVVRDGEWEALLAVDRFATIPLDYAHRHKCLVFGTHGEALAAHPRAESEIDSQSLYSYCFHSAVAAPATIRKHHRRLLPGHRLLLREGRIEVEPYVREEWGADGRPLAEIEEERTARLRAAVEEAASGGGTGVLPPLTGGSALEGAFGGGPGPLRAYAAVGVAPEDVLDAIPRLAEAHSDPFAVASAVEALCSARLAASEGAGRVLADEGLLACAALRERQMAVERHGRLPGLLRIALAALPGRRRMVREARLPLPGRLHAGSPVVRLGARGIFTPDFLKTVDTEAPLRLVRHVWSGANARSLEDRMLAHDAKYLLADRALPAVSRACEIVGVEAAFPLLSDDVASLEARLSAGSRGALARRALRPAAPGLPLDEWLRAHRGLQQLLGDTLSALKKRAIVRPGFVDEAVKLHRAGEETSAGAMIWALIMLEQWFRAREPVPVG